MLNIAEKICRKVGENLRRPALHDFIRHCVTKLVCIATPNSLTDSYARFLTKAQPHLNLRTLIPKFKPYIVTLPKYTVFFALVGSLRYFITLL